MLVLLIIFMVAAPLATVDTAVNPPSSNARPQQRPNKPIYLLKSDLSLAIGDNPVACERLATALDVGRPYLLLFFLGGCSLIASSFDRRISTWRDARA
jgi:hypothetical protein